MSEARILILGRLNGWHMVCTFYRHDRPIREAIGILAAIAIPLYANVQARARLAKAQADARALASAVSIYSAHVGSLPTALTALTSVVTNSLGQPGGPFMASIPNGPSGWGTYVYTPVASAGTFTISNSGDSTSVSLP